jgi:hypothetical protein
VTIIGTETNAKPCFGWGDDANSSCGQPEQLVNDAVLGEGISLSNPRKLAFVEPMHGFIALDGPLRGVERPKSQTRIHNDASQNGGPVPPHYLNTCIV